MKIKLIIILLIVTLATSCVSSRVTNIPNSSTISSMEEDRIEILGQVEGNSSGGRVWVVFIPVGWAQDSWVESRAYKKALKDYSNANGLIDQIETYHKTTVPLIVITPQLKSVKVTGIAYHIRTDIELEKYRQSKKQTNEQN